ncbi:MAG: HAMP domain-containing sensor histidine kinase [Breoghania sp.]|nr:HAMP domain-containing sensor histidine kinase [Breoghania sp.]
MQRQFVSMTSHEFRTPLAIIDGAAQWLKRGLGHLEPEAVLERLDNVREAVRRINYLIKRFIDFLISQDDSLEISPERHEFLTIIQTVCEQQQAGQKTHEIILNETIGNLVLNIDRRMIEQCLVNVIGNAIKYSPVKDKDEGPGKVLVDVFRDDKFVSITVSDFGVGIPKSEIKKVFGRFYRASTSSGIPGTGIGLNLTEMIISRHKGRVAISSELGKGSTITLRLPIMAPDTKAAETDALSQDADKTKAETGKVEAA